MKKRVDESRTEQVYVIRSSAINGVGRLFGGQLMQWIDELAGVICRRHSGIASATVAIDNLNFQKAAYQNDMIVLVGKMTYVGKTSMEVRIDTYVEDGVGTRRSINRAYVVMVAIDKEGNPLEVPGLIVETEEEKAEWHAGEKRYQLRKTRRREGY